MNKARPTLLARAARAARTACLHERCWPAGPFSEHDAYLVQAQATAAALAARIGVRLPA